MKFSSDALAMFSKKSSLGYGLAFIAVFGWGASTVFGKKLAAIGYKPFEIMSGRFMLGLIFLSPVMYFSKTSLDVSNTEITLKIILMAFLSGFLAMYFYYQGLKRISARLCAVAEMFFPFCAVAANWIFLGKSLSLVQIIGSCLLLLGSTVLQLKRY